MSQVDILGIDVCLAGAASPILKEVVLTAEEGKILVLLGHSGSGKTTLLRSINRLVPVQRGRIEVGGRDIASLDPVQLRLSVGYVIQGAALFPHWTVEENAGVVLQLLGWAPERIGERVDELLELVRLAPDTYRGRFPENLSGGQRQRVGVARALAAKPGLVLMDEPFGALDPLTREALQDDFRALQRQLGFTVILVTHDMAEALLLADRIAFLQDGHVIQADTPSEILRRPASAEIERMLATPAKQAAAWSELLA